MGLKDHKHTVSLRAQPDRKTDRHTQILTYRRTDRQTEMVCEEEYHEI